jgi:hypothetical protein
MNESLRPSVAMVVVLPGGLSLCRAQCGLWKLPMSPGGFAGSLPCNRRQ